MIRPAKPLISFSFDDFPRSALHAGGAILERYGVRGTYYVALGLMDQEIPAGRAFTRGDLDAVLEKGHQLGCHTFRHSDAWETPPSEFEESVAENQQALDRMIPGASFRTLSYPIAWPRPGTKRRMGRYFPCCRGGGESINAGPSDAANLRACFLEKNIHRFDFLKQLVDQTCQSSGWLIFATHDVSETPTQLGCSPQFLEKVVAYALASGAQVLPVADGWGEVEGGPGNSTSRAPRG